MTFNPDLFLLRKSHKLVRFASISRFQAAKWALLTALFLLAVNTLQYVERFGISKALAMNVLVACVSICSIAYLDRRDCVNIHENWLLGTRRIMLVVLMFHLVLPLPISIMAGFGLQMVVFMLMFVAITVALYLVSVVPHEPALEHFHARVK